MTVAVSPRADRDADLIKVADEVGVFVDYTKKQLVELDETGGLEVLRGILREKTSAQPIVESATVEEATTSPSPTPRRRLRGALRAARNCARRAVRAVREALTWLVPSGDDLPTLVRAYRYRGRHHVVRSWYGVQRSTCGRIAAQRRNAARQPDDSEPALPEYFVSYLAQCIEAMRGHEDALHPKAGYQFRC